MTALPFLIALLSFVSFALATDPHHRKRFGGPCPRRRVLLLRAAAWAVLAVDFGVSLSVWGVVFGPIGWFATIMVGAAAAFCLLNLAPARKSSRC